MVGGMSLHHAWDTGAETWARFARSPDHDHFFWRFNLPRFLELLPAPSGLTLDIGCGEGRLGRELLTHGHRVLALDASPTMAQLAAQHAAPQPVVVADAAHLPVRDRAADLAVAFMSLHNMEDLMGTVREIGRVLTAGGRFCLAAVHPVRSAGRFAGKDPGSPFTIEGSYFEQQRWTWTHQHSGMRVAFPEVHRPLAAYTRALEDAGFLVEAIREPIPDADHAREWPEVARWGRVPCFLHLRAVRP